MAFNFDVELLKAALIRALKVVELWSFAELVACILLLLLCETVKNLKVIIELSFFLDLFLRVTVVAILKQLLVVSIC